MGIKKKENKKSEPQKEVKLKIKTEISHRIYQACEQCPPIMSGANKGQLDHCPHCHDTRKTMIAWVEKEIK